MTNSRYYIEIEPGDFNRGYAMYVFDLKLNAYIHPVSGGFRPTKTKEAFMTGVDGGQVEAFAHAMMEAIDGYKLAQKSRVLDEKNRLTTAFKEAADEARPHA